MHSENANKKRVSLLVKGLKERDLFTQLCEGLLGNLKGRKLLEVLTFTGLIL